MIWTFPRKRSVNISLTHIQAIDRQIYIYIYILVPVAVYPLDGDIHIGLSDTLYTSLNASVAAQLSTCITLPCSLTLDTNHERQCESEETGRYVYVYTQKAPYSNYLDILEFRIYGDLAVETCM